MAHPDSTHPSLLTIGTCNRRAGIIALVDSFKRCHPAARTFVCLVDRPAKEMPPLDIPETVFFADELSLPGGRRFLFKYDAFELCCALKPFAIAHLAEQHSAAKLLYLDSDILVLSSFWDDLEPAWGEHSVLLTPHLVRLPGDVPLNFSALWHNTALIMAALSLLRGCRTERFMDCWCHLLARLCTFDPMSNVYVDQRWLDLLTASSATVGVLLISDSTSPTGICTNVNSPLITATLESEREVVEIFPFQWL